MDHDQEKFYTDEEVDSRAADQQGEQEVNDTTYFIELMKHLRTLIERGSRIPLSNKVVIDGNKCLMILDEIDKNLPDAIQYGIKMYSERDRLLTESESTAANRVASAEMKARKTLENARRTASQIIADADEEAKAKLIDAEERANHMISEDEIVRQAREEARSITNEARVKAGETRLQANHDAYRLLSEVETRLDEKLKEVRRLRMDMTNEAE